MRSGFEPRPAAAGAGLVVALALVLAGPATLVAQQPTPTKPAVRAPVALEAVTLEPDGRTAFLGESDLGPVHLVQNRFRISTADCLAHLTKVEPGHVWHCTFEFPDVRGGYPFNDAIIGRVVWSDLDRDCMVTVRPLANAIKAEVRHARGRTAGPTIPRKRALECVRAAFSANEIDDRTFTYILLRPAR